MLPITDGSIAMYDLSDQAAAGQISSGFFTDGNVGAFRHLASDNRTGNVWYVATDGSFREMNPDSMTNTGRVIPFSAQVGANPGAYRHLVVDPINNLMLYSVTDGSIASIDLGTLQAASFTISAAVFRGANPGAARTITLSPGDFSPLIQPDIKANNSDGPITISTIDALSVTVRMNSGMFFTNLDYWIVAQVGSTFYSYDPFQNTWRLGILVSAQGTLVNFNPIEVLNVPGMIPQIPPGTYTFYFAVDNLRNGVLDVGAGQLFFDSVVVNVTL